ncbi:MAG: hypothetical protein JHD17_08745 [Acidimicrobiia bacterium]|nr:hypothetical protein [Acidimicrobiia bacterium]MCX6504332.1 hypothetical protein [Actinomycetota bacterium]
MTSATREWVNFDDPKEEGRSWKVDVTFLLSSWTCIFGSGCQGVLDDLAPELVQGCCSYGAHFTDRKDREHTVKMAKKLSDEDWEFAKIGRKKGVFIKSGKDDDGKTEWQTRLHKDACVFLNRPGFAAGPGCAFHFYSMRTGEHHSDIKPEVCWQLPLRSIDEEQEDGTIITTMTEFSRDGWGEGGSEFAWWCTDSPDAFVGSEPVYESLGEELKKMMGKKLFAQVKEYLDERRSKSLAPVVHPADHHPVMLKPTRR